MEEPHMHILHRIVQGVADLEKTRCEMTVKLYRKVGLYRRLFESAGMKPAVAAELEAQMLSIMNEGIAEQYALFTRFTRGEITFAELVQQYKTWCEEYAAWCDRVSLDAFRQAV
jgi:hypothetical protein